MRIAAFVRSATIGLGNRKVRVLVRVGGVMEVELRRFRGWWVGVDVDCARRNDVEEEAKRRQTTQTMGIVAETRTHSRLVAF